MLLSVGMEKSEFRTVFAGVRPARIAVLFDERDTYWHQTCQRIIECLCSLWGGEHSLMIPTDGTRIDPIFWDILRAFDADYFCEYHKRGLDLKLAEPQRYDESLQAEICKRYADEPPRGIRSSRSIGQWNRLRGQGSAPDLSSRRN